MESGILIIDKPEGVTSRDVVNKVSSILKTKKVGHTGTLDPLATGVMVVLVNDATKISNLITSDEKTYIATVEVGILTDTLDITGKVLDSSHDFVIDNKKLAEVLKSFIGKYEQEVPLYSAVRVNGKRLYDYARSNEQVILPKREVEIKNISLLYEYDKTSNTFSFIVKVSKGTYIRSLIRDIDNRLGVFMTMKKLRRIEQGNFHINDSISIDDVSFDKLINIKQALLYIPKMVVKDRLKFKIENGCKIELEIDTDFIMFVDQDDVLLAIYEKDLNNPKVIKSYRNFRR